MTSVPYSQRTAQQRTRSVAIPIPVWRRLQALSARFSDAEGRLVTMGEVVKIALDRAELAEDQS